MHYVVFCIWLLLIITSVRLHVCKSSSFIFTHFCVIFLVKTFNNFNLVKFFLCFSCLFLSPTYLTVDPEGWPSWPHTQSHNSLFLLGPDSSFTTTSQNIYHTLQNSFSIIANFLIFSAFLLKVSLASSLN